MIIIRAETKLGREKRKIVAGDGRKERKRKKGRLEREPASIVVSVLHAFIS